jgi:hypothetical protein
MNEHDTTNPGAEPDSAVFGNVMAGLLGLAILYAIAAYVQWGALLSRFGGGS